MPALVQNAVVTLAALAALGLVVRRTFGGLGRSDKPPACPSCTSGGTSCAPQDPASAEPDVHVLTLVKRPGRQVRSG